MPQVQAAVKGLLARLRAGDTTTLLGFNETMFVLAERESDAALRAAAVEALVPWGGTAFFDATVRSLELVGQKAGRRGIIIFSDGDDRHSVGRRDESLRRIEEGQVVIYTVGFGDGASAQFRETLKAFAEASGGRAYFPRRAEDLDAAFGSILDELSHQVHPVLRLGRAARRELAHTGDPRLRGLPGAGEGGLSCRGAVIGRRRIGMCAAAIVAAATALFAQTPPTASQTSPAQRRPRSRSRRTCRPRASARRPTSSSSRRPCSIARASSSAAWGRRLQGGDRRQAAARSSRSISSSTRRRRPTPSTAAARRRDHDQRAQGERPRHPAGHRPGQPRPATPARSSTRRRSGCASMPPQGSDRPPDLSGAGPERRLHRGPRQGRRGARQAWSASASTAPPFQQYNISIWEAIRMDAQDLFVRSDVIGRECRANQPLCPTEVDMQVKTMLHGRAGPRPAGAALAAVHDARPGQAARAEACRAAVVRLGDERARRVDGDGLGGGRRGARQRDHPHLHRGDVGPRRVALAARRCDRSRTGTCS